MSFSYVQKASISIWYRKKSFLLIVGHLTCYKQYRDTYNSIFKTLDPMHSHRTIKSKFQLGTEGTYLNLVHKKLTFVYNWSFDML